MIPAAFEYVAPKSLDEALALLSRHGSDARPLAGGHSLIPMMKLRLTAHKYVVDLGRIPGLAAIEEREGRIEIGAMATHAAIEGSRLLNEACPLLPETAHEIGDLQVRNWGTIGGSLAHADPAADYPAAVLALDAEIVVHGKQSSRTIRATDFFVDLMTTALKPGELITAVRVPKLDASTGTAYAKFHHPASGFALVGVAAVVTTGAGGEIIDARIGVTGIAPKAFRARGVEDALRGAKQDALRGDKQGARALLAAAAKVAQGVDVLGDVHASSDYRTELARVYTRRALERALARTKKK